MKITQTKRLNKKTLAIIAIGALLICGILTYLWFSSNDQTNTPSINYDNPTEEQKRGTRADQDPKTIANDETKQSNTDQPLTPTPVEGSDKQQVQVMISASNVNESAYQLRSIISAILPSDATCTLTLSNSSSVITKTSGIQNQASVSTCKGFDIPLTELSSGEWTVRLNIESESYTGSSETKVTI